MRGSRKSAFKLKISLFRFFKRGSDTDIALQTSFITLQTQYHFIHYLPTNTIFVYVMDSRVLLTTERYRKYRNQRWKNQGLNNCRFLGLKKVFFRFLANAVRPASPWIAVFSERELTFTFATCYHRSVCRLSVCL